ncbi:MAG: aminotransferase class I/II-fold pyridoxal phosphate-dependent enzyme [Anaerovorax sp.]
MYRLNDKVKNLVPYDAVAGDYKVRLDANESFVDPGEFFKEEIAKAVGKVPLNRYPDPTSLKLRKAFSKIYGVKEALVVAGNGSDELITVILGAFLQSGDRLATLTPDFSMYGFYGETYERKTIEIEKREDLSIDVDQLIAELKEADPQVFIFSNPCSPTSLCLKKEEVDRIIKSTSALVVLDEAYMEFSDQSLLSEVENYDNLLILKTCSKAWGLAALRLGFALSNKRIVDAINSVRSPYNVNAMTQAIGELILSHPAYIEGAKKKIIESRENLYTSLLPLEQKGISLSDGTKVPVKRVVKSETNFVLVEFHDANWAKKVYEKLLKHDIIVRILGNFLRITAGTKDENQELKKAL